MDVFKTPFVSGFMRMARDGWKMGWHERNGGNLTYRLTPQELEMVRGEGAAAGAFIPIGAKAPSLGGEAFLVTGSGKYLRNAWAYPEETLGIIELDASGEMYRVLWGLRGGGRPTSELPTHLMNHAVKRRARGESWRVIYHCHPANLIALTFVLPLDDAVFTRELWQMATECPVVFPDGVGVVGWMVPGGEAIARETAKCMERYDAAVWAHHGLFCAGEDFDSTFGLAHTVEKAAEIAVKVRSMGAEKRQAITSENFRALAKAFGVALPEEFLR